jgi:hypothetical protein
MNKLTAPADSPPDYASTAPYIKFMRSEATDMLLKHPGSFMLLALIAYRARREVPAFNPYGMQVGEAMLGDPAAVGLSRQQFRTALANLQKWKLITIRTTNKGTIARLSDRSIYDINAPTDQPATQPDTNQQPNLTATTNKNERIKEDNKAANAATPTPSSLEHTELAPPTASSSAKATSKKIRRVGATADEVTALLPPHPGDKFAELWTKFHTSPQHAKKALSAFEMMLTKLGKYPEEFALVMLESAIQGGWSGVENPGTARAYEQWQADQATRPPAPTIALPVPFDPAELFGLDSTITHAQALAHNRNTPEYAAYLARQQAIQTLTT